MFAYNNAFQNNGQFFDVTAGSKNRSLKSADSYGKPGLTSVKMLGSWLGFAAPKTGAENRQVAMGKPGLKCVKRLGSGLGFAAP